MVSPRSDGEYIKDFSKFRIYARAASSADVKSKVRYTTMNPQRVGRFQLFDDSVADFNVNCVNTLMETDNDLKNEVQFMWVAPPSGSGCVAISAMVYENPQTWFADSDQLTKIICEGDPGHSNMPQECCACDEAKYEVCEMKNQNAMDLYSLI